jgi:hypothetical protein
MGAAIRRSTNTLATLYKVNSSPPCGDQQNHMAAAASALRRALPLVALAACVQEHPNISGNRRLLFVACCSSTAEVQQCQEPLIGARCLISGRTLKQAFSPLGTLPLRHGRPMGEVSSHSCARRAALRARPSSGASSITSQIMVAPRLDLHGGRSNSP